MITIGAILCVLWLIVAVLYSAVRQLDGRVHELSERLTQVTDRGRLGPPKTRPPMEESLDPQAAYEREQLQARVESLEALGRTLVRLLIQGGVVSVTGRKKLQKQFPFLEDN